MSSALRVRSFCLTPVTLFTFGLAMTAWSFLIIPYVIKSGYKPASAALAMSIVFASSALCNVVMGWFSDRMSAPIGTLCLGTLTASIELPLGLG